MPHELNGNEPAPLDSESSALATPAEVARMLRVPSTWVYAHQKDLPGLLRLGRYVRFRRTAIEEFLSSK